MIRITRGIVFYILACQMLLAVANIPFYRRIRNTPDGFTSLKVHRGPTDYFTYLTFIRESRDGAWQVPALFTVPAAKPSFIYIFYIALGKVALITGLSPEAVYHLSRIFTAEVFFLAVLAVSVRLTGLRLGPWAAITGILSSAPILPFGQPILTDAAQFRTAGSWWYNLDPVFRADWVQHHYAGAAVMILAIYCLIGFYRHPSAGNMVTAVISGFVSAVIYPTTALITVFAFAASSVYAVVRNYPGERKLSALNSAAALGVALAAGIGVLVIRGEIAKGFPWSQWAVWDIAIWNQQPNFERDFLLSGGLVLVLALPVWLRALIRRSKPEMTLAAFWLMTPYLLLPFANRLGIAKIRFGFTAHFIPMGIFAVMGVAELMRKIRGKLLKIALAGGIAALFIGYTYPSSRYFYDWGAYVQEWESSLTVIPDGTRDAVNYLTRNSSDYPTVISEAHTGAMLPAYAPVRTYFGHVVHTRDYEVKKSAVMRFFQVAMTESEAAAFLEENGIRYIFRGPDEKAWGKGFIWYRNLPVRVKYENRDVTVYEVL